MTFDDVARRMAATKDETLGPPSTFPTPAELQRAEQAQTARRNIVIGLVLVAAGAIITIWTHATASNGGGTYVVAYGPVIFGFVQLARGLMGMPDRTPAQIAAAAHKPPPTADREA